MAEIVYTSEVRLTQVRGALRLAHLPAEDKTMWQLPRAADCSLS
jgi:hypothetical protein